MDNMCVKYYCRRKFLRETAMDRRINMVKLVYIPHNYVGKGFINFQYSD